MSQAKTQAKHTPGDVNHQFLAVSGHEFCSTCGVSLRGKRTELETEMLAVLEEELDALRIWLPENINADVTDGMFISIDKIKNVLAKAR